MIGIFQPFGVLQVWRSMGLPWAAAMARCSGSVSPGADAGRACEVKDDAVVRKSDLPAGEAPSATA